MSAKILIVEDSPSMRKLVRDALESGGYEVWESSDGREGLQVLPEVRPDLIITDVNMPELDGINMVREIRAQPEHRLTPVVILTTESSDDMKQAGRAAGATAWIVKPFVPHQLLKLVQRVLRPRSLA
jgi:two-component system, chemotaxis family, chemotaxis protein CheY